MAAMGPRDPGWKFPERAPVPSQARAASVEWRGMSSSLGLPMLGGESKLAMPEA